MTTTERAELYRDFLAQEGFRPEIDDDGDIRFKVEGKLMLILLDDDETFFRLACPGIWSIDDERERAQVLQTAADVTMEVRVAKVFPVQDDTWAAIEMFVFPPAAVLAVLPRSIAALQYAVATFRSKMQALRATA